MSAQPIKKNNELETTQVATEQEKTDKVQEAASDLKPTVIMTNLDAHIHERMKGQPKDLDAVLERQVQVSEDTRHRLALPKYFEKFSYDHSQGKGQLIFRWLFKHKQAMDYALNVRNWLLVNKRYFKDAPLHLFSSNGGVEEGDSILAFMPAKQALALRAAPGRKSKERLDAQLNKAKSSDHFYEPSLDSDGDDVGGIQPDTFVQQQAIN